MKYLNGYFTGDNFNGCLMPFIIEFDDHDFSNDDLRLMAELLKYCLKNRNSADADIPRLFEKIVERYNNLSDSAQDQLLMDARKLSLYEHQTGQYYTGDINKLTST
jgi:hypothetical protein